MGSLPYIPDRLKETRLGDKLRTLKLPSVSPKATLHKLQTCQTTSLNLASDYDYEPTVAARKLEYDRPPTPKRGEEGIPP